MLRTLLLFLFCLPMFAGISRVQSSYAVNGFSSNMNLNFKAQLTKGNTVVVFVAYYSQSTTDTCTLQSVTDGSNNQYINEGSTTIANQYVSGRVQSEAVFLANNVIGGTNILSINYGSAPNANECLVNVMAVEYMGVSTTTPVDSIHSSTGQSGGTPDNLSGSITLSNNNVLVLTNTVASEGGTIGTSSGFNFIQAPIQGIGSEDVTFSTSGTHNFQVPIQSELYFPNAYIVTSIGLIPKSSTDYGVSPFSSIAKVQEVSNPLQAYTTSSTNANITWTSSVTPSSSVSSGNTILLMVYLSQTGQTATINGIKDSLGNVWKCAGSTSFNGINTGQLYYSNLTHSGSDTITAYFTGSNNNTSGGSPTYKIGTTSLIATEISGIAPLDPDSSSYGSGYLTSSSTSDSVQSLITSAPNDILFAVDYEPYNSDSFTPASGYSTISTVNATDGSGNYLSYGISYKVVTASGTYNTSMGSTNAPSLSPGSQIPYYGFGTAFHANGTTSAPITFKVVPKRRAIF